MKEPNPCHALCLLRYNMPSCPQLRDWRLAWQSYDATFGSSFAVPNSWTGTRPIFFEAGGTECFRTLPKKWHFSLPVSYQFLQRPHIIPNLFCGSWSLVESRKLLDCELQACLKGFDAERQPFLLKVGQLNANGRCLVLGYIGVKQDLNRI